jgi:hypothetical protein
MPEGEDTAVEVPRYEETTDENGNTVIIGYPSDGATAVYPENSDTTSDGSPGPGPAPSSEEPPQGGA